jgi:hypothetical protein
VPTARWWCGAGVAEPCLCNYDGGGGGGEGDRGADDELLLTDLTPCPTHHCVLLLAGECCNTCVDIRNAYRKRGWAFNLETTIEMWVPISIGPSPQPY